MFKLVCAGAVALNLVALGAVASFPLDKDEKAEAIRRDRELIQGKWRVVHLVDDGKVSKPNDVFKVFIENGKDGSWSLMADGKVIAKGPSTINPDSKPKTIDFYIIEDNGKRVDLQGIYELNQRSRKLCFAAKEKGRPKVFEAPKGSGNILLELERKD